MVDTNKTKHGISEAAAEVLAASIRNSGADSFGAGTKLNPAGIAIQTMDLGPTHYRGDEKFVDYTRGVPHAVPPGQTPPVGAEGMHKLPTQPQQTKGYGDNSNPQRGPNPNLASIAARQTNVSPKISTGKGNVLPPWAHEDVDFDDEDALMEVIDFDDIMEDILDEGGPRKELFTTGQKGRPKIFSTKRTGTKAGVRSYNVVHVKSGEVVGNFNHSKGEGQQSLINKAHNAISSSLGRSTAGRPRHYKGESVEIENEDLDGATMQTWKDKVEEILNTTTGNLAEDVDAIFNGETLSEEFKTKATTIFEAAVGSRVHAIAEQLEELALEQLDEAVEEIKEELTSQVDDYLNYMVEEWLEENEIAIEKGLKSEIVEDFISGLRNLFIEHYIDIPEEKVDLVSELTDKVDELTDSLNTEIARGMEMRKIIGEAIKTDALDAVCEGLVQTQVEKLRTLAASVEFTTDEEYLERLETLRESYFPTKAKRPASDNLNDNQLITEEDDGSKPKVTDPLMRSLVDTISRTQR